jgi:hypothetical protein
MFCFAARTANHAFERLSACRGANFRRLTDRDPCDGSEAGKEQGQGEGDGGSEQDDFKTHVLGLHGGPPNNATVMDARFGGKVDKQQTAPRLPFLMGCWPPGFFVKWKSKP